MSTRVSKPISELVDTVRRSDALDISLLYVVTHNVRHLTRPL
jgi:hypothetical protein